MALLATGVVVTLWLSTQAIAGSYKLDRLHEKNSELAEQVGKLDRTVTKRESASWLAQHAHKLGMVPGGMAARLVVDSDGSVSVVGDPEKVTAPDSDKNSDKDSDKDDGSDTADSHKNESDHDSADDDSSDGDNSDDEGSDDDGSDDDGSDDGGSNHDGSGDD